jgi:uncharacterized protein (DUF2249 family)
MIPINANTKIASLIKMHPDALETIVSISPKFTKLRNPILRKVIAGRTSIAMASRIGGCSVQDFFNRLQPLGFDIDTAAVAFESAGKNIPVPAFMKNIPADKITELDVRPVIDNGKDPLSVILQKVKTLETGSVLKIINSFEPTPLMLLLGKQGFESYAEVISDEWVNTYFYKVTDKPVLFEDKVTVDPSGWDEILNRFNGKLETVDVREMEMPLPMHTILETLNSLPVDKALYVYHKRIPVFLLPELEEMQFSYRIKEVSDGGVHLLIYKD